MPKKENKTKMFNNIKQGQRNSSLHKTSIDYKAGNNSLIKKPKMVTPIKITEEENEFGTPFAERSPEENNH